MRTARNKDGLALVPILDLPQKRGDVGVFIDKQCLYAEALQIICSKLLLYLGVLESIIVRKPGRVTLFENAVVIARLAVQAYAHAAQDVVEIWIGEAEAQTQKHLRHEIAAQIGHILTAR